MAQRQIRGIISARLRKMYPRLALRLAATIMAGVHTRALTAPHPIKPTSPRCHSAWSLTPAEAPLIDAKICSDNRDQLYRWCDIFIGASLAAGPRGALRRLPSAADMPLLELCARS